MSNNKSGKARMGSNGILNPLSDQQEQMRLAVVELELKARYWKAMYDIRHYTLEAEKLQSDYDTHVEIQRKKEEELRQQMQEQLKKLQEAEGTGKGTIEGTIEGVKVSEEVPVPQGVINTDTEQKPE